MSQKSKVQNAIKLQSKRTVELWIYSFADMYMILSVFFIALSVIYAAKVKQNSVENNTPSAGRGPASVESMISLQFPGGSSKLDESALAELNLFLPVLKSAPKSGRIVIEGYSSNQESSKGFSSRLDLSNKRAVTVAEWLSRNGIHMSNIQTFSFGDGKARKKDSDPTGFDQRRVVIKLASYGDTQ